MGEWEMLSLRFPSREVSRVGLLKTEDPCLTDCVRRQAGMTDDGELIKQIPLPGGVRGGSPEK